MSLLLAHRNERLIRTLMRFFVCVSYVCGMTCIEFKVLTTFVGSDIVNYLYDVRMQADNIRWLRKSTHEHIHIRAGLSFCGQLNASHPHSRTHKHTSELHLISSCKHKRSPALTNMFAIMMCALWPRYNHMWDIPTCRCMTYFAFLSASTSLESSYITHSMVLWNVSMHFVVRDFSASVRELVRVCAYSQVIIVAWGRCWVSEHGLPTRAGSMQTLYFSVLSAIVIC